MPDQPVKLTVVTKLEVKDGGDMRVDYAELELPPGTKVIRQWPDVTRFEGVLGRPPGRPGT